MGRDPSSGYAPLLGPTRAKSHGDMESPPFALRRTCILFGSLGLPYLGDKLLSVFIIGKQNENSGLIKLSIIILFAQSRRPLLHTISC